MIVVNDNLGTISLFGSEDQNTKGCRVVDDSQHGKEESRLSLKIAKFNLAIDPSNKYYQEELEKAQRNFLTYSNK